MKFLVVCAVALCYASVNAQDGADAVLNLDSDFNPTEALSVPNLGSPQDITSQLPQQPEQFSPSSFDPLQTVPPTGTSPPSAQGSAPGTPQNVSDSIFQDLWKFLEKVYNGSETIPMALVRMEVERLNRRLYSVFDYKLVLLMDCPELKKVDLGTVGLTTLYNYLTQGMPIDAAVSDGVLRLRNQALRRFGLMVVAKNHVCQNPTKA